VLSVCDCDDMSDTAHPFRRQLLINTGSSGVANAWAMVATLVSLPLVLGGLGSTAFGTWVLLQTFSASNGWLSLADVGVVVATTVSVAEEASRDSREGVRSMVSASVALCGALGLFSAVVLAVLGRSVLPTVFRTPKYLVHDLKLAIALFAVQTLFDLLINSIEGSLEGLQRVDISRAVDMSRRTLVTVGIVTAALVTGNIVMVALASMAATVLSALVALWALNVQLPNFVVLPRRRDAFDLVRHGRSIALLRPLGVLQRTMDRAVVGAVLGPAAVTYVEIATQLQSGADAVLGATTYSVVPAASWLKTRDARDSLAELTVRGTRYSMLVTMPVVVLGALLAKPLIEVWVGRRYVEAAGLTVVALANVALTATLAVGSQALLGLGRASVILRAALAAILVNLAGSLILVHHVGIVGVFQATLLGTCLLLPLLAPPILSSVQVAGRAFVRDAIAPSIVPSIALALALLGILRLDLSPTRTLVLGSLAGSVVYAAVAYTFSLTSAERATIAGRLGRTVNGR